MTSKSSKVTATWRCVNWINLHSAKAKQDKHLHRATGHHYGNSPHAYHGYVWIFWPFWTEQHAVIISNKIRFHILWHLFHHKYTDGKGWALVHFTRHNSPITALWPTRVGDLSGSDPWAGLFWPETSFWELVHPIKNWLVGPASWGGSRGGQHCLRHGQIFGRAKQLFCLLVLLLLFGSDPTSGDTVRFCRLDPPLDQTGHMESDLRLRSTDNSRGVFEVPSGNSKRSIHLN